MRKVQIHLSYCLILFGLSFVLFSFPNQLKAQDKPAIYSDDPKSDRNDDEQLCVEGNKLLEKDKFCKYYKEYKINEYMHPGKAADYRDKMIYLVKGQIDDYYDAHKNGRVVKTKWFQTVLDILGIGLAFSGTIVNGVRPKTVLSAVSGSFLAGRDSINDRFQLLQHQILINKMDANRLERWTLIVKQMELGIGRREYPWDAARTDLQQYLFRGSFTDALNSLVSETGGEVDRAKRDLEGVLDAVSKDQLNRKLENFKTYIVPMDATAVKLQADIATLAAQILPMAEGAPKEAKKAEKAELEKKLTSLLENYKNIWLAIKASGDFEKIDEKIRAKWGGSPAVIGPYNAFLAAFNSNPSSVTAQQYDFVLTKVNAVVGGDEELNKRFLEILKANKLE